MAFFSLCFLIITMAVGTENMRPTEVKNHDAGKGDVNGIESITEVVWNSVKSMNVKTKLMVKAKTQLLPISVYHDLWKLRMALKQSMTRIASIALFWTPTSTRFNDMATLIIMDNRFKDDYIKSGEKEMLASGSLNLDVMGSVITAVPFDPNFQQFITGSLDFATDTMDINKVKFYLSFPDNRMSQTDSTAGFIDISWKTMPDENGVYEKVLWDVFTFPLRLPAEVELMLGKSKFTKVKNYLDKKYNERKELLSQLEDISCALVYGSDQGLNKIKNQLNEDTSASTKLLIDSNKREEAIKLKKMRDEISDAKSKLTSALSGNEIEAIQEARSELEAIFLKYNIELPAENKDTEKDGYAIINDAD
ncbi:putative movement protein [Maple mottle-associated virus]|uniref:Putative movement protein n=1 Tax=Maple mottle-associated virus TaxID=2778521 RepID=A0A7L8Y996_9VIRU|nr:putative movement protein [Maple mottle-associated virus]QOI17318.1 putative movement protein [Maple mottle-associated virus]